MTSFPIFETLAEPKRRIFAAEIGKIKRTHPEKIRIYPRGPADPFDLVGDAIDAFTKAFPPDPEPRGWKWGYVIDTAEGYQWLPHDEFRRLYRQVHRSELLAEAPPERLFKETVIGLWG